MEQYVIKGGTALSGEVEISGAKNAALGILAGAIMTDETVTIENLPNMIQGQSKFVYRRYKCTYRSH